MNARFVVPADHPALPGHFPGHPVVPGVVVLEHVVEAALAGTALRLVAVPQAKFVSPLEPGVEAEIEIERDANRARFTVTARGRTVAQGALAFEPLE